MTYDLYSKNPETLVKSNISSGYVHSYTGTEEFFIRAYNLLGSIDSNMDPGTGLDEQTFGMIVTSSTEPSFIATGGKVTVVDNNDGTWIVQSNEDLISLKFDNSADVTEVIVTLSKSLTDISSMFEGCANLIGADVTAITSATNTQDMFKDCPNLLHVAGVLEVTENSIFTSSMFKNCTSLKCISGIDTSSSITKLNMFDNCPVLDHPDAVAQTDIVDSDGDIWHNANVCGTYTPTIVAPIAVIDFNATDNLHGEVVATWSDVPGLPKPTYNLYRDGVKVETNIDSGYAHPFVGTADFYIAAVNVLGSIDSNIDEGIALPPKPIFSMIVTSPADPVFTVEGGTVDIINNGDGTYNVWSGDPISAIRFDNGSEVTAVVVDIGDTIIDAESMFLNCNDLVTADVATMVNVTNTTDMFKDCTSLTDTVGIREVTTNCLATPEMFKNCTSLKCISGIDTRLSTSRWDMFTNCPAMIQPGALERTDITDRDGAVWVNGSACGSYTPPPRMFNMTITSTMKPGFEVSGGMVFIDDNADGTYDVWSEDLITSIKVNANNSSISKAVVTIGDTITDTEEMFYNCTHLIDVDVSVLHDVADARDMFKNCTSLTTVDVTGLDEIKIAHGMFEDCTNLHTVDTSNMSEIVDASDMFWNCSNLTTIDVSNLSNVKNAYNMFEGCSSLTEIDISHLTSVTNTTDMFKDCISLETIKGVLEVTKNSTLTSMMFDGCSKLECFSGINTRLSTDKANMFHGCTALVQPDATVQTDITDKDGAIWYNSVACNGFTPALIAPSKIIDFQATDNLHYNIIMTWTDATGILVPTYNLFENGVEIATDIQSGYEHQHEGTEDYYVVAVNALGSILSNTDAGTGLEPLPIFESRFIVTDATTIEIDDALGTGFEWSDDDGVTWNSSTDTTWNISAAGTYDFRKIDGPMNVKYGSGNAADGSKFTEITVISNEATSTSHMFDGCSNVTTLDLSLIDTSNVTTNDHMFSGCSGLTTLDVSTLKTDNVTDTNNMFSGCSGLTTLDLSNFDISSVINTAKMFNSCTSLECISNLDTTSSTNKTDMFDNCGSLLHPDMPAKTDITDSNGAIWFNPTACATYIPVLSAPSQINDFNATDDINHKVKVTWTHSTGLPIPTYDLYRDGHEVATDIKSGYQYSYNGTADFHVVATNSEGTEDSNIDEGTGLDRLKVTVAVTSSAKNAFLMDQDGTNYPVLADGLDHIVTLPRDTTGLRFPMEGNYSQHNGSITNIIMTSNSSITSCSRMFQGLTHLVGVVLTGFNNVQDCSYMFDGAGTQIAYPNTGVWRIPMSLTANATNVSYMFRNNTNLRTITNIDTRSATNKTSMFSGATITNCPNSAARAKLTSGAGFGVICVDVHGN